MSPPDVLVMRELRPRCIRFCNPRAIRSAQRKTLIGIDFPTPSPADGDHRARVSAFAAAPLSSNAEIVGQRMGKGRQLKKKRPGTGGIRAGACPGEPGTRSAAHITVGVTRARVTGAGFSCRRACSAPGTGWPGSAWDRPCPSTGRSCSAWPARPPWRRNRRAQHRCPC